MKIKFVLSIILILSSTLFAQFDDYPRQDEGYLTGGFGINWIDGEAYYRFSFRPEVSFANFGLGLDLNLDINKSGKIRHENFNEASDYLSIIRYIRYGLKNDPVFLKVGALDYYTLGHGSIMYQYNNSPTFDARKIGIVADLDFSLFGFESMLSSVSNASVLGLRSYVRPFLFSESTSSIPIVNNIEFGLSFASDFNEFAGVTAGGINALTGNFGVLEDKGSISIIGADIGIPVLSTGISKITLYSDYTKIIDFGSGLATGVKFDFDLSLLLSISSKLERRFNNGKYLPSYFNSLYEIERFRLDDVSGMPISKIQRLDAIQENMNGYFGSLLIRVLSMFDVYGSYQRLDKDPKSGILNLRTAVMPEGTPFVLRAGYDKINIQDEKDLFKLDDRSYLFTEVGYKPIEFIIVSIVYNWTFTPVRDNDDKIISYEPQKRIEPRVSFVYPFGF